MSENKIEPSNRLTFPFMVVVTVALMYILAFHNMRDKYRECKEGVKVEIITE